MSVVVRMEMPQSCEECPLVQTYENDWGDVMSRTCNLIYKGYLSDVPKGERRPDCPIICQLPEGHGRLVDADDLERYWLSRIALMDSCAGKGGILESVERSTLRSCIEDIGNSKTIVPAERSET